MDDIIREINNTLKIIVDHPYITIPAILIVSLTAGYIYKMYKDGDRKFFEYLANYHAVVNRNTEFLARNEVLLNRNESILGLINRQRGTIE